MTTSEHTSEPGQRDRAVRNETLFREVTEQLKEIREPSLFLGFLCECGRHDCEEEISLTASEYRLVRARPSSFAVKPGHFDDRIETVARKTERHWVVEKLDRSDSHPEHRMNGQGRL